MQQNGIMKEGPRRINRPHGLEGHNASRRLGDLVGVGHRETEARGLAELADGVPGDPHRVGPRGEPLPDHGIIAEAAVVVGGDDVALSQQSEEGVIAVGVVGVQDDLVVSGPMDLERVVDVWLPRRSHGGLRSDHPVDGLASLQDHLVAVPAGHPSAEDPDAGAQHRQDDGAEGHFAPGPPWRDERLGCSLVRCPSPGPTSL